MDYELCETDIKTQVLVLYTTMTGPFTVPYFKCDKNILCCFGCVVLEDNETNQPVVSVDQQHAGLSTFNADVKATFHLACLTVG